MEYINLTETEYIHLTKTEYIINLTEMESKHLKEMEPGSRLSNISANTNISIFIEDMLGDSHINYESLFFLTIIYSIFLVVGVLGNLATCIVIMSNEYMRTATNVYLFNLAIADIATLVISKNNYFFLQLQYV